MLTRLLMLAAIAGTSAAAFPAGAEIVHVVPPSDPASQRTFVPVPGGSVFTISGQYEPFGYVSDYPNGAWVGFGGETGSNPIIFSLDEGQSIGPQIWDEFWIDGALRTPAWEPSSPQTSLHGFYVTVGQSVNYGWVRLSIPWSQSGPYSIDIVDYAYEASPSVPIPAGAIPSPGAAALLALAGAGLHRRTRS